MASNIFRFLTNIRKNPKENRLINAIANKFPEHSLGANTPFPNQALETATYNGNPCCLYFTGEASKALQDIRNIAQVTAHNKFAIGLEDKPVDFVCFGYLDHSGDIIITEINNPSLEMYREEKLNLAEAYRKSLYHRESSIEVQSKCFDYLRENKFGDKGSIGLMPVALIGTTRPIVATTDGSENCPKFSEIARAILPANVNIDHPIISGTLSVSPKYQKQTPSGESVLSNGSLECVLIDYKYNKNNTVTPDKFFNVTRCQEVLPDESRKIVDISKSKQPLDGLPILSEEHIM